MASVIKVLGQVAPAAATLTTLYTSPASTVISTLFACNRGADTTIRVAVRPSGAAIADQHYLYFDLPIPVNQSFAATCGLTLAATDVVSVSSASGLVSFSAFGEETS